MVLDLLLVGLGLVILLLAGDALVRGAVNLSLRLGIPALIVSLTIVAFGTSAPELLIAVQAALEDAPGIAMGNVVGSNTANILLVLGVHRPRRAAHIRRPFKGGSLLALTSCQCRRHGDGRGARPVDIIAFSTLYVAFQA